MTATQFAWECCDCGDYQPTPKQRGSDAQCWLCGGATNGVGWRRKDALSSNFTDHNIAARLDSSTLCQACAATASSVGWEQYCRAHPERGLWIHFPEKEGKTVRACNWLYFSHVFTPSFHEAPTRKRWREILAHPPAPPFLMVMAISGKKQILFRGRVSQSAECFWVQVDTERVLVRPEQFRACLSAFEALYHVGFSKDSIVSGQYHTGQLMTVGLTVWRELEQAIQPWRNKEPGLMAICHYCAQKPAEPIESTIEDIPQPTIIIPSAPKIQEPQLDLFF